jgi:hypothetical protein
MVVKCLTDGKAGAASPCTRGLSFNARLTQILKTMIVHEASALWSDSNGYSVTGN